MEKRKERSVNLSCQSERDEKAGVAPAFQLGVLFLAQRSSIASVVAFHALTECGGSEG